MKQGHRRFGEWVRTTREAKGWSQTDLAKYLRRSQVWVSLLETGKLNIRERWRNELTDVLGWSTLKRGHHLDSVPSDACRLVARNANNRCPIHYIRLEDATPRVIEDLIEQSPSYEISEIRDLLKDVEGAIHQIPKRFRCEGEGKYDLKNIRGYFGRSSAGVRGLADNIYQRFRCGYTERKDSHGIILAVTSLKATALLERFGIGFLEHLKKNNGLCISNATKYDNGRVGTTEPGFLYMTFKMVRQAEDYAVLLTPRQIEGAINQMMKEPGVNQLGSRVELKDAFSDAFRQANEPSHTGNLKLKPYVWPTQPNRKIASF